MKDPFNIFIEDSVYLVQNNYYKLIFKTKRVFFEALSQKKSSDYFIDEVKKIWGNVDHSFMNQKIRELEEMVAENNKKGHEVVNPNATFKEIFELDKESIYQNTENKYMKDITTYYKGRIETLNKEFVDSQAYLTSLVDKYDNYQNNIPYFNADGTIRCYHNVASYNSMVFNVNINRAGWNRTYYDADLLGNDLVYLPAHPGACPLCMEWQGRVYSISGKNKDYPRQELAIDGGVGHPNCKHQWTLYWDKSQLQDNVYNSAEWENKYDNKQKLRGLELKRTKLKNDMAIYKEIGNFEEVDKAKSKISLLNDKIKELKG